MESDDKNRPTRHPTAKPAGAPEQKKVQGRTNPWQMNSGKHGCRRSGKEGFESREQLSLSCMPQRRRDDKLPGRERDEARVTSNPPSTESSQFIPSHQVRKNPAEEDIHLEAGQAKKH